MILNDTNIPEGYMPMIGPDELLANAAKIFGPYDQNDVDMFAAHLCGLGGLSRDEMLQNIKGLTVPTGFAHLRIINVDRNIELYQTINSYQSQLELHGVMVTLICAIDCEIRFCQGDPETVWHETVALPITNPGRLELGIRYRQRRLSDASEEWILPQILFNTVVYGTEHANDAA